MKIEKVTSWNPWGITLESADDEYCTDAARIVLYGFRRRVEFRIPQIIQPYRIKHTAGWDAATVARLGRDWYYEIHPREFGFRLSGDFLQVFYGPQTHSSCDTKNWCYHLPWLQWRHIRTSMYDTHAGHFWSELGTRKNRRHVGFPETDKYLAQQALPKVRFRFNDYDGQEIKAATHIEEREWLRGEGWWKWLCLFYKPMVRRSLDIEYSKEVGPRKGSWKGGTIGCGIDLLPNEMHEAAFRRHCKKNNLAFIGRID